MRLDLHKLPNHLKQALLPVYLVAGDEPLQHGETLDQIRHAAKTQGYTEREILEQDAQFKWSRLNTSAATLSLFGQRRLVELRLLSSKIGKEGSEAIGLWLKKLPPDTVLLISSPKLDRGGAKWTQAIAQHGGLITVWPLNFNQLVTWLDQRLRSRNLIPAPEVAAWLAERVEGNLLAGAQEVDKLALLQEPGPLSLNQAINAISNSARYSIFDLADSIVDGKKARSLHILQTLQAEGTASAIILWVLIKEAHLLAEAAFQVNQGMALSQAIASRRDIREHRRPSYTKALAQTKAKHWELLLLQCSQADMAIKGLNNADPWQLFECIILGFCKSTLFHKNSICQASSYQT